MRNDEMYLQLYIIRHAESMGNVETDESFDKTNPPLTLHGKKLAEALGRRFADLKEYTLYASPLERAVKTASNISVNMIIDNDLLERGVRKNENGFEDFDESDDECIARAERVINRIKSKHINHESVIIVAHGMFAQFLIRAALDIPFGIMRFSVYNASVTKINFCKTELPKLALQNDISHLIDTDGEKLFWM